MNYQLPEDWNRFEVRCLEVHGCSSFQLKWAVSKRDRKAQKKIEREQADVKNVVDAVRRSIETNPDQTTEELTKSVIAILAPWFLQFLGSWLLTQFQTTILNWIIKQLKPPV